MPHLIIQRRNNEQVSKLFLATETCIKIHYFDNKSQIAKR